MSTIAEQLRVQAADLRKQAAELEATANRIDGLGSTPTALGENTTARLIAESICEALRMPIAAVLSQSRRHDLVEVRDICAHAFRHLLGYTYVQIAAAIGRNDHGSACAAITRVRNRRQIDRRYCAKVDLAMRSAHATLAKLEGIETATTTAAEERIPA